MFDFRQWLCRQLTTRRRVSVRRRRLRISLDKAVQPLENHAAPGMIFPFPWGSIIGQVGDSITNRPQHLLHRTESSVDSGAVPPISQILDELHSSGRLSAHQPPASVLPARPSINPVSEGQIQGQLHSEELLPSALATTPTGSSSQTQSPTSGRTPLPQPTRNGGPGGSSAGSSSAAPDGGPHQSSGRLFTLGDTGVSTRGGGSSGFLPEAPSSPATPSSPTAAANEPPSGTGATSPPQSGDSATPGAGTVHAVVPHSMSLGFHQGPAGWDINIEGG